MTILKAGQCPILHDSLKFGQSEANALKKLRKVDGLCYRGMRI
jgi:hypothetical protein